jgi:hypothetical protein
MDLKDTNILFKKQKSGILMVILPEGIDLKIYIAGRVETNILLQ